MLTTVGRRCRASGSPMERTHRPQLPRRVRRSVGLLLGLAVLVLTPSARGDPVTVINAIRTAGCTDRSAAPAVVRDKALDTVARELPRRRLSDALEVAGYPAATSTSFHVGGSPDDAAIRRILVERYCGAVSDPRYVEVGAYQRGNDTWIVLAARLSPPAALPSDVSAVAERVLELVNVARLEARLCGRNQFAAAAPLTLSSVLSEVARLHALDMAQRGSLGHRGSDGSRAAERITRSGYSWRASGENVAAGQRDAEAVVAAWLDSPEHCSSIMGPQFTEMGVAFALVPASNPPIYWTQVFATPR